MISNVGQFSAIVDGVGFVVVVEEEAAVMKSYSLDDPMSIVELGTTRPFNAREVWGPDALTYAAHDDEQLYFILWNGEILVAPRAGSGAPQSLQIHAAKGTLCPEL